MMLKMKLWNKQKCSGATKLQKLMRFMLYVLYQNVLYLDYILITRSYSIEHTRMQSTWLDAKNDFVARITVFFTPWMNSAKVLSIYSIWLSQLQVINFSGEILCISGLCNFIHIADLFIWLNILWRLDLGTPAVFCRKPRFASLQNVSSCQVPCGARLLSWLLMASWKHWLLDC